MSKSLTNNAINQLVEAAKSRESSKYEQILTKGRDALLSDISTSNNFVIDAHTAQKLQTVFESVVNQHTSLNEKISTLKAERQTLDDEEGTLAGRTDQKSVDRLAKIRTRKTQIDGEVTALETIVTTHIANRKTEYQQLASLSEKFLLDGADIAVSKKVYNISPSFMQLGEPAKEYKIFSGTGEELAPRAFPVSGGTVNGYAIKVTKKDGMVVDAIAENIKIDNSGKLDLSTLRLYDQTGTLFTPSASKDIKLDFYVGAKVEIGGTGPKYLVNMKKVVYTPKDVLDSTALQTEYDTINTRSGNHINTLLAHTHATKYADARKEVIFKLLGEEIAKDQFAKLTDDQKNTLLTRLVALTAGGYDMDIPTFQTSFKTEMTKDEFLGTPKDFEDQLLKDLDAKSQEKLKKILTDRLESATIGGQKAKTAIVGEFMHYLTTVNITKDAARRETLYNAVDVRTGGQITRQLAHIHTTKYKDTKKQVLLKLMEETVGKEVFDKLSDKQKDACLASLVTTGYDMDIPTFQTSFRTEIAKEDFTGTEDEFEKKLITNLDGKAAEQLQKILEKRLDSATIGGQKARSILAGRFLDYVNNSAFDVPKRHAAFQVLEGNLTAELLQTRLRQEFELKFNKLQREAFEKTLALNPEFGKLNQAQKDRIYERIQELGTINAGVVDIKLGDQPTTPPTPLTYSIPEITFAPTLHQYSVMPSDEDYAGFSTWLVNQLPADVGSDPDKYRDWMRNGLVASLDNGKTHYENFFADVLKKFTENINVKTTLNQTLLDFINDTNTADHMAFDADLLATLTSTTPLTDHPKKRYQKLMPWVKGEPQNYLSFFQGQSQEFKTESITAGGKTFGYSGKLEIGGAENVNMSIKMKDGQEQIYKSGSPVALVRTLLTSTDIEPPHARFHAGLSVIKSVTKMARGNDISLRTALTPEMLDTLPFSIRTTLAAGENPMVEIEEKDNGKLVATVFNLNLTTRRKENLHTMFDEEAFVATQSVRDLRQGVESLLALTNQTLNNTYANYREASRGSGLRKALLSKHRYGGLANFWKTISFEGETISVGGKTVTLTCKDGLFTFTGEGITKPIRGRNLGSLLTFNPALRGIELKALHVANEKLIETYQEKLEKKDRMKNYGVIDEINHRVYILDKYGNLGYVENTSQDFASRWRQYNSGHSYGRIKDDDMPTGFRVMKKGKNIVDKETYNDFLRNEALVGPMVRAMSRTYRAVTTWAPWD